MLVKGEFAIRVLLTVLVVLTILVNISCTVGTSSSETNPPPTATKQVELVIANVAAGQTASVTQIPSPTSTVRLSAANTASQSLDRDSAVPIREEVRNQGEAPNLKPSGTSSREMSGVILTVYNCVGSTGARYCPEGSHTKSGTEVGPGTAACDLSYLGRKFQIVGDQQGLLWTCLDTGNFGGNLFDLWFYNLGDGLTYINNLPYPYQVTFVD